MKRLLTAGLILIMMTAMAGCGSKVNAVDQGSDTSGPDDAVVFNNGDDVNPADPIDEEDFYVSPTDDYAVGEAINVGEIIKFDGDKVHIMSGDLIQVYEYDSSNAGDFYLGQTVSLIKGEEKDRLEDFIIEDFSQRYTNMGHLLTSYSGQIIDVTEKMIIIEVEGKEVKIRTYEPFELPVGANVTAVAGNFGATEEPALVYLLDEDSKLSLTVKDISRSDAGDMMLALTDANGGEYSLPLTNTMTELNFSEIIVGDVLTVYHKGIMESWPMQIDTVLVTK